LLFSFFFLAVGDPTSFIFSSPWETGVMFCKPPLLLSLSKREKKKKRETPGGFSTIVPHFPPPEKLHGEFLPGSHFSLVACYGLICEDFCAMM